LMPFRVEVLGICTVLAQGPSQAARQSLWTKFIITAGKEGFS
jgi:hypothetical protein